ELGVAEVLRRLAGAGLPVIEVSQVAMTEENVVAMERARGEHGIEFGALSGTMEPARPGANPSLLDDYDDVVSQCRRLGASRVRIGMMPLQAMRGIEQIVAFCHEAEQVARRLADDGIQLSYHHHHVEFARVDGRQVMDIINTRRRRWPGRSTCTGWPAVGRTRCARCSGSPRRWTWCT